MDYLRGNAPASAMGIYVICKYLSFHANGRTETELRGALEVLRTPQNDSEGATAVLTTSLAIGQGLGLISRETSSSPWCVAPDVADAIQLEEGRWEGFRGLLTQRIMEQGLEQLKETNEAPDLLRGLTWFMQLNPIDPPGRSWEAGPYPLVKALDFDAIARSDQWRPFRRWAVALGFARLSETAKVVLPDASTAIADQIPNLPKAATVAEWLSALRDLLPILGGTTLLEQLPSGGSGWAEVPPGLVLGLLKLEAGGMLALEASDDGAVIPLGLGSSTRQVGRILVREI